MKKFLNFLCLFIFVIQPRINAQLISASHSSLGLSINVIVDINTDMVDVTITGPIDNYWAYGFGSIGMNNTYAISTNADGSVAERKLGDFAAGRTLISTITSNVETIGDTRILKFTRSRIGSDSDYFTFPNTITSVPIIFANPPGISNFSYHGSGTIVKNNDAMGLIFSVVVPVIWSDFKLAETKKGVAIDWITEKEVDNKGFTVQRSVDGKEWIDLAFIEAQNPNGFSYYHNDKRALPGVNYYRLIQEDWDGKFTYSGIKSIGIGGRKINTDIHFYPNPVIDQINLELPSDSENVRVQIRSVNNLLLYDEFWRNDHNKTIDVGSIPSGHYFLSLQSKEWAFTKYFIKQ